MMTFYSIKTMTPNGPFYLIIDQHDVAFVSGFAPFIALVTRLPRQFHDASLIPVHNHPYQQLVREYYHGSPTALTVIPRLTFGTPFQQAAWEAMSKIPYGHTKTYREIGHTINKPNAVRAIGSACKANRLPLIIPCHRVVKSDGTVGDYFYGTDVKLSLLQREGAFL